MLGVHRRRVPDHPPLHLVIVHAVEGLLCVYDTEVPARIHPPPVVRHPLTPPAAALLSPVSQR